ncbi:hypothetical protein SAMN05216388_1007108 [Halorientalis persicus]|jgi:hypothetical protein|uniref:Uncharacterized protein n=1 Tax=Halorientalis persicus TaxID=1367881 RepID=A0A1H8LEC6_9EURY|nr:hypothetical protein [Halorientalis persicus]SEO03511.1 hypothetical protein SAMN05216388_1007108 [Halorientalis persicus]
MATDTAERRAAHVRGLKVTTLSSIAGIGAAVASSAVTAGMENPATSDTALLVVLGAILVQFPILKGLGVDVDDFGAKDYLYVGFMTFALWFVSWGVLLTANTTLPF